MYSVVLYSDESEFSAVESFLDELYSRYYSDKNSRIQYDQIMRYIQFLSDYGTRLGEEVTKQVDGDIWELRPGNNRVFFFYFENNTFVLLHCFRKKTNKTPRREIERARTEMADWRRRKGTKV